MNKLEEFNSTVTSLQQEVENLHAIQNAYQQLAKLVSDYDSILSNLNQATQDMTQAQTEFSEQTHTLQTASDEQRQMLQSTLIDQKKNIDSWTADHHAALDKSLADHKKALEQSISKQESTILGATSDMKASLEKLTSNQKKQLADRLQKIQDTLEKKLKELHTLLESSADRLSSENKEFYNSFADTVQTRLVNNRMEIQQLIDTDNQGLKQMIDKLQNDYQNTTSTLTDSIAIKTASLIQAVANAQKILTEKVDGLAKQNRKLKIVIIFELIIALIVCLVLAKQFRLI